MYLSLREKRKKMIETGVSSIGHNRVLFVIMQSSVYLGP